MERDVGSKGRGRPSKDRGEAGRCAREEAHEGRIVTVPAHGQSCKVKRRLHEADHGLTLDGALSLDRGGVCGSGGVATGIPPNFTFRC